MDHKKWKKSHTLQTVYFIYKKSASPYKHKNSENKILIEKCLTKSNINNYHLPKKESFHQFKLKKISAIFYVFFLSYIILEPTRIISVSAHKWVIYDFFTMKYIRGYRAHNKSELGVFSKLLVFCTINTLIKKHKLDPRKF